ncbi:MAG: hypothetical protein ACT4RN_00085, partial [Pseudonocardia sp.]
MDSLEWGERFDTAQALAGSFQATVYEPWWPERARARRYRRRRPDSRRPFDTYAILADLPGRTDSLIVRGIAGSLDELTVGYDWQPVSNLDGAWTAVGPDGTVHLLVPRPGLVVQLARFGSLAETVEVAHTLRGREAMEPPSMLYHIVSSFEGDHFDDAQALADALGRPVHEPGRACGSMPAPVHHLSRWLLPTSGAPTRYSP